jgi:metal-dependent amidase/aminoacylase/carboxypeptidase family protein
MVVGHDGTKFALLTMSMNKQLKSLLIIMSGLLSTIISAQKPAVTVSTEYFQYVVGALSHDSMQGRLPGTVQEKQAAEFIAIEMARAGCSPIKQQQWLHPFSYVNPDTALIHSAGNVIGKIDTKHNKSIVISAHYDHIGNGKFHSNDPFSRKIHNGADDNASGVAMMLGLAAWCKTKIDQLPYDVIFVAFSGEEDGLWGANALFNSNVIDTSTIIANINLDMVGRLDFLAPILEIQTNSTSSCIFRLGKTIQSDKFKTIVAQDKVANGSDHAVFLYHRIPAILISTGLGSHYHRPSDDAHTINYVGMIAITTALQKFIIEGRLQECQ